MSKLDELERLEREAEAILDNDEYRTFEERVADEIVVGECCDARARAMPSLLACARFVEAEAGFDCDTYDKYMNVDNTGCRCKSCRARRIMRNLEGE